VKNQTLSHLDGLQNIDAEVGHHKKIDTLYKIQDMKKKKKKKKKKKI